MIKKLQEYILDNWDKIFPGNPKPDRLSFFVDNSKRVRSLIWVFDKRKPIAFVKRSYGERQILVLEQEYENIKYVRSIVKDDLKEGLPLLLGYIRVDADIVLIMNFISGDKMSEVINKNTILQKNRLKKSIGLCINWLCRFQQQTKICELELTKEYIQKEYFSIIDKYKKQFLISMEVGELLDKYNKDLEKLIGEKVPIICSHGDFFPGNIHLFGYKHIAVLDWADMQKESLPFWDLFMFFCSYRLVQNFIDGETQNKKSFDFIFIQENWFSKIVDDSFNKYASIMKIDRKTLDLFFPLFLLQKAIQEQEEQSLRVRKRQYWDTLFKHYISNRVYFLLS